MFALAVSTSADLQPVPGGCTTIALNNDLTQQEYGSWLLSCDFVLLPYLAHEYAERTSGPFVEAIVAGKPPLILPEALGWRMNCGVMILVKCIIDFDGPDVFSGHAQMAC